jgi:hypothetical protein
MRIEQALYGEHRGGHSLLKWSGDAEVSARIVHRLDLPDTVPPGVEWSPFFSGFPYRDRYVLSRTFRDTGASRSGMVFSHALLARLGEIVDTADLRPLLKLFVESDRQRPDVTTVELVPTPTSFPHSDELVGAAEALVMNGRSPVVRLGHIGFEDLVVALWARLSPEIRKGFAFRLSFDPRDLVETPLPALVCTPSSMAARWSSYPLVQAVGSREPTSLAAAVLSGHEKAAPLLEFMQGIGSQPTTCRELCWSEQAYVLGVGESTVERRLGALRLIEKLSPDPDAGKAGKNVLVQQLCELVPTAEPQDILLLRNLQFSAVPSPTRVWNAVETWAAKSGYRQDQDVEMLSVLGDATDGTAAVEEWRTAVLDGFASAARAHKRCLFAAFWRWLQIRADTVAALCQYLPNTDGIEEQLADATPTNLDETAAMAIGKPALSRGWFRLHGRVLSASCSPLDAVSRQVAVDTDPSVLTGLRSALRNASPPDVVACGLRIDDPRMPRLAGEVVAEKPSLLGGVDMSCPKAQAVWREALAIDTKSWQGPTDPEAAFHLILDRMLDSGSVDTSLITLLSKTALADLGTYPRRSDIWSRIRGVPFINLVAATANGWLREAPRTGVPFVPDDTLQSAILESDEMDRAVDALVPDHIDTIVEMVAALDGYNEQRFRRSINNMVSRTTALTASDGEAIGRLLLDRGWQQAVSDVVQRYKSGRQDLRPVLRACHDMLGPWDRFTLRLMPISESEKWQALESLAADLYPGGPDDEGLWERAGGKNADLRRTGSGRARWREGIRYMRQGKLPAPSALLTSMIGDFPNNQRLVHLARDVAFRGKSRKGLVVKKRYKSGAKKNE